MLIKTQMTLICSPCGLCTDMCEADMPTHWHPYGSEYTLTHLSSFTINEILQTTLPTTFSLTHCGLVTPYGDRDWGQHGLRQWLVAWRHQAITWTNVDWSSVKSSDVHMRAVSQEIPQPLTTKISLKITRIKFTLDLPEANELMWCGLLFL